MSWGGAGGAGFGFVWQLFGLLVVIAVVLAGIYLVLTLLRDPSAGTDDALAVLRQRYARGQIDEEEFEKRASQLSAGTAR